MEIWELGFWIRELKTIGGQTFEGRCSTRSLFGQTKRYGRRAEGKSGKTRGSLLVTALCERSLFSVERMSSHIYLPLPLQDNPRDLAQRIEYDVELLVGTSRKIR